MRCFVVLALVALAVAEPPAVKDNSASETKDKRGVVGYGTTSDLSGAISSIPAVSAGVGYPAAVGHSSLLTPSVAGLGVLSGGYGGYSSYGGLGALQAPIGLAGLSHGYAGLGHGYAGLGQGYAGLGHGYAVATSPLALSSHQALPYQGLALGGYHGIPASAAYSGIPAYSGLSGLGLSSLSLASAVPAVSGVKLGYSESYSQPEISQSSYLTPPSKSYGVPSTSSYSSSFQPITSSYSSPSTSYGVPSSSSSYSTPSSSYGPPSSSYGVPAASSPSYSAPSSSYGAPSSSDSYNTVSYSSRDYRSNH